MLCNEALVVNAQHTSSDVHAKLEPEGARAALIAQDLFFRVFKNIAQQILASRPKSRRKKVDKQSDKQCDDL